jgi:hypothetical protein
MLIGTKLAKEQTTIYSPTPPPSLLRDFKQNTSKAGEAPLFWRSQRVTNTQNKNKQP